MRGKSDRRRLPVRRRWLFLGVSRLSFFPFLMRLEGAVRCLKQVVIRPTTGVFSSLAEHHNEFFPIPQQMVNLSAPLLDPMIYFRLVAVFDNRSYPSNPFASVRIRYPVVLNIAVRYAVPKPEALALAGRMFPDSNSPTAKTHWIPNHVPHEAIVYRIDHLIPVTVKRQQIGNPVVVGHTNHPPVRGSQTRIFNLASPCHVVRVSDFRERFWISRTTSFLPSFP